MSDEDDTVGTLTRLLQRAGDGDEAAQNEFCELVYDDLRRAAHALVPHNSDDSVQSTELVHDFLVRLIDKNALGQMHNRRYFFKAATDQMRKILVDHWRRKKAAKRGGNLDRQASTALDRFLDEFEKENRFDIEALENALEKLRLQSPRQHEVIQYRFYGGLTVQQTAELLDLSVATVQRDWRLARAKLYAELRNDQ